MMKVEYKFSFTAASLRVSDMMKVAKLLGEGGDGDSIGFLGKGNSRTEERLLRELKKRINCLTGSQLVLLKDSDYNTQRQVAFLSICKTYGYIYDFVVEVMREKVLVFDYQINNTDYNSFLESKSIQYNKLENLSELTKNKVKQVMFKMLEQAGIINNCKEKIIQPQLLDREIIKSIKDDNSEWLKIFFYSDIDIKNI